MKIIGIIGWKNSGKTFLAQKLISHLTKKNFKVASIKHAHHNFDIDKEGTDSFLHRMSGSKQVIISSSKRWAKISELNNVNEKTLTELISELDDPDIVVVEGFKKENHPKIELIKNQDESTYLFPHINNVLALVTDLEIKSSIKKFKIDEIKNLIEYILNKI